MMLFLGGVEQLVEEKIISYYCSVDFTLLY
jgi:hypothetical protein